MKSLKVALFVAAVSMGAPVVASAAPALKIAVINVEKLVTSSPQYTQAQAQIKAEFEKRGNELQAKGKQLAQDVDTFQRNADVMTPDDRVKKENDLMTRRNDLKYQEQKFQQDFQGRNQQLSRQVMEKLKSTITKIAQKDGYTLVLQDPIYADGGFDITDQVLAQLKAEK